MNYKYPKPKYKLGDIVRDKVFGGLVNIIGMQNPQFKTKANYTDGNLWYSEDQLKPYRPSRTGKLRDKKGRFTSPEKKLYKNLKTIDDYLNCRPSKFVKVDSKDFKGGYNFDSKQQSDKKIERMNYSTLRVPYIESEIINKFNEIIDKLNTL